MIKMLSKGKREKGMGVVKTIKLFVLLMTFAVAHANATTINYSLDQSNALLDGDSNAQVTISDNTTRVSDIDINVELIASTPAVSSSSFEKSNLSYFSEPSSSIDATKSAVTIPEVLVLFGFGLIGLVVFVRSKRSV
jgi:hypothetical protein